MCQTLEPLYSSLDRNTIAMITYMPKMYEMENRELKLSLQM